MWVLYSWYNTYNNIDVKLLKNIESNIKYNTYLNIQSWNNITNKYIWLLKNGLWLSNNLSISWYNYSVYNKNWNKKTFNSIWFNYDKYWNFIWNNLTVLWNLTWNSLNNLYTKLYNFNDWLIYLIWGIWKKEIKNQFTLSNIKINNFKLNKLNWKI